MSEIAVRPRFRKHSRCSPQEVAERLQDSLSQPGAACVGHFVEGYVVLKVPASERHFWSPQLSVSFEEEEDGTIIRGLYGPDPAIWAFFFYGRAIVIIIALMICTAALSEWWLHDDLSHLGLLPPCLGIGVGLWAIARYGRMIGAGQTLLIQCFFDATMQPCAPQEA